MVPVIVVIALLLLVGATWQLPMCVNFRRTVYKYCKKRWVTLSWWAITARIAFFDFQIVTKFTYVSPTNCNPFV